MADLTTNPVTLQGLSDIISAMQREINDLSVIVGGHTEELDTHDTDINTLQDPPTGVPIPLIEWYGLGHTTKEVDTILANDINGIAASSASSSDTIGQVSDALDQEINDRTVADAALQDVDVDLQTQVTDNLDTLNQEITDRSALSSTVSDQYDSANTRFDSIESSVADLTTSGESAASSASAQIDTINQSLQVAQTQILQLQGIGVDPAGAQASQITALTIIANDAAAATAQETIDRRNADIALQASINTLNASISGIQSGLDSEVSTRAAADAALETEIGALEASIAGSTGAIAAETAARTAADAALTTSVNANTLAIANNQTAIATEVSDRTTADTSLQGQITTNTTNVSGNTTQIATNTADITQIKGQFGVVKDVGGYVTDWQQLDQLSAPGDFNLKNLNSNARLFSPGYPSNYFAPVAMAAFTLPVSYDTNWGAATINDFHGTNANDYTRNVQVYSVNTVAINGSVFKGVNYGTGGDTQRLGQVITTFKVEFSGAVNRYLSLWYRIKNDPTDTTQRWFPVAMADNTLPAQRTYEQTSARAVVQISVTADKVIEFGLTVLNTLDATIASAANDMIYGGSVGIVAINMVTVT